MIKHEARAGEGRLERVSYIMLRNIDFLLEIRETGREEISRSDLWCGKSSVAPTWQIVWERH